MFLTMSLLASTLEETLQSGKNGMSFFDSGSSKSKIKGTNFVNFEIIEMNPIKHFMLVSYDSRVVLTRKLPIL